jgi:hypothetical protein
MRSKASRHRVCGPFPMQTQRAMMRRVRIIWHRLWQRVPDGPVTVIHGKTASPPGCPANQLRLARPSRIVKRERRHRLPRSTEHWPRETSRGQFDLLNLQPASVTPPRPQLPAPRLPTNRQHDEHSAANFNHELPSSFGLLRHRELSVAAEIMCLSRHISAPRDCNDSRPRIRRRSASKDLVTASFW